MLVTLDTSHVEMSPSNDDAELNMSSMLDTLDTSHLEMSPLNDIALAKNALMSVTTNTSQDPIGPCGPLSQSVDSCRHSLMAAWRSALDFGAHPVIGYFGGGYTVGVRLMIRIMFSGTVAVRRITLESG